MTEQEAKRLIEQIQSGARRYKEQSKSLGNGKAIQAREVATMEVSNRASSNSEVQNVTLGNEYFILETRTLENGVEWEDNITLGHIGPPLYFGVLRVKQAEILQYLGITPADVSQLSVEISGAMGGLGYPVLVVGSLDDFDSQICEVDFNNMAVNIELPFTESQTKEYFLMPDVNEGYYCYFYPDNVTLRVEYVPPKLTKIEITKSPTEVRYLEGENFNSNGMEVTAYYSNGTNQKVTAYTVNTTSLSLNDKYVRVSYTENGITKTCIQYITVMKGEQGYWGNKYYGNACIGDNPQWNLATLGVVQSVGGNAVGNKSFEIGAELMYVQQMPKRLKDLCAGMPANWKLDVQQFVLLDGKDENDSNIYKYIDAKGFIHTFYKFDSNRYYDVEGMGLILSASSESEITIENLQGDQLHFTDGRLDYSKSGRNVDAKKMYQYDSDGMLIKVYDDRDETTCLSFTYNGVLTQITAKYKGAIVQRLKLEYEDNKLSKVSKTVGANEKDLVHLRYDNDGYLEIVYTSDNAAVKFNNSLDTTLNGGFYKTDCISHGYMNDDQFVEVSKLYWGTYNVQTTDFKTMNEICLRDENNLNTSYFLDGDARIIGQFEGNRTNGYKTLHKEEGLTINYSPYHTSENLTTVNASRINNEVNGKIQNGKNEIDDLEVTEGQLDGAKNLALSFYLYHACAKKRLFAKVTINNSIVEWRELNASAYEVWQKVVVPFTRPNATITSIKIEVYSGTQAETVLISNLKLIKSEKTALHLKNGAVKFKDCAEIRLYDYSSSTPSVVFNNQTSNDLFMSESDVLMTLRKAHIAPASNGVDVYLCNGRKIKHVQLGISAGSGDSYCLLSAMSNADSEAEKHWFIQKDSADGSTVTKQYITFGETEIVDTLVKTETVDTLVRKLVGEEVIESETQEIYNKFGQIMQKTDERGAKTNYEYFDNGELCYEAINADGKELILFEVGADDNDEEEYVNIKYGGFGAESYEYNKNYGTLDKITKYDYNINTNSYTPTNRTFEYAYDDYYETLRSITAKEGDVTVAQNTLSEDGNVSTVGDGHVNYKQEYDPVTQKLTVSIETATDSIPVYSQQQNGLQTVETYYNDTPYSETTTYDKYGKVLQKGPVTYSYIDADKNISAASYRLRAKEDSATDLKTVYSYDNDGQVKSVSQKKGSTEQFRVTKDSSVKTTYQYGNGTAATETEYDTNKAISPRVKSIKNYADGEEKEIMCWKYDSYDSFGRVTQKSNTNGPFETNTYTFSYKASGTNAHNLISTYNYNEALVFYGDFFVLNRSYEYDGQGNIVEENEYSNCRSLNATAASDYQTEHSYTYDSQNRLTSVTSVTTDHSDNFLSQNHYEYTYYPNGYLKSMNRNGFAGSLSYDDRGRLFGIQYLGGGAAGGLNSFQYTYDDYGNRTVKQYYNYGQVVATYTWARGRLLSSVENGNNTVKASYTYNADGVRYSKSVEYTPIDGAKETKYTVFYYDGNRLMGEDRPNNKKIRYFYDGEGICGFRYGENNNWKEYTYVKNLQGDIVLIKDSNGYPRVKYEYDPLGRVGCVALDIADDDGVNELELGELNPFRYRGYYYDEETGLYYLMSRYYDPEVGQFISPDSFNYLNPHTIGGVNLYAYCLNNPVNYKQRPVSSGGSITDSSLSETLGVGFVPIVGVTGGSFGIFNQTLKGSFRNGLLFGSGSITGLYADWNARAQIGLRKGTVKVGIAGKFSVLNVSGQIGFGTEDLNLSLKVVGDALTVSGMAGIFIDPKKNTYFIGAEAKATALSGRVGGQLDIFGLQIEAGLSGELGSIGGRLGIGLRPTNDGKMEFYFGSGFALGVGWDFYIRIRFDGLF
ncbi:MAG: hypothetical protein IKC91_05525 [Clostridia bacterium]|nr:hypothetical protein [Clostridia bacterium]